MPTAEKVGASIKAAAQQVKEQVPDAADQASARIEGLASEVATQAPRRAEKLSQVIEVRVDWGISHGSVVMNT